ncbi:DNA methyltransferase [candidate division TA06 bacterium B3_TA06]|uniref:DNA methyltransferase n=1 Tax=candidate division TA06 bacterium B3_TA06 TaxID=2012487 RepID=A0A532V136_UNCT6|nr:MAG: DNA methyltransferase [candidate division TA06 bacterium B3_TA06]
MSEKTFTERVVEAIKRIPKGKVATYGQIAMMAGNYRGARQVVRVLHSMSEKEGLSWHRVINSKGTISLTGEGYRIQKQLLKAEGITLDEQGKIDFDRFLWKP